MMRYYRILFISILLSFYGFFFAQGDNLRFQRLTIKEGLSQSSVNSIIQDHYGFIWLGTQDGLNKFDGVKVEHYKHRIKDKNTLSNSYVTALLESRDQLLWVATLNGGLNYKKPLDRQFQRIDKKQLKGNLNIIDLIESQDQFIWMTTEESGLYKYRLQDDSLRQYKVSDGITTSSLIGAFFYNERLVVASKGNGFFLYDNKKDVFTSIPLWNNLLDESTINDVYIYNDTTIFVGTNHGVVSITGYVDVTSKRYLSDKIISAVFCEDASHIWAGTRGEGLYGIIHENDDINVSNFKNNMFDLSSISSDMIFDIIQDFSGNIWITTEEGVSYFDPLKQNFSLITNNIGGEQRLSDKNIWTIYEESDSVVWVGTRKGLSKINIPNQTTLNYPFFSENKFLAANNDIWDICVDENNQFWVGTNSGIYQFNPAIKQNNYKKFSPSLTDLNQPIYDITLEIVMNCG